MAINTQNMQLPKALQVLLILFLGVAALIFAKPFLVPLCFAGLFAMLLLPLSRKMENKGMKKGLAAFLSVLFFLAILAIIISLITWQVGNLAEDLGNIEEQVKKVLQQGKDFISQVFGISEQKQEEAIEKQTENANSLLMEISTSLMGIIVDTILMIVYMFLLMYYRSHIKKFIMQLMPKKAEDNTDDAIQEIEKVSQQYITGLGIMIVCLWIMYGIGFTILGLKNAILFAVLCGLFEIVPFVGNLTGNALAAIMALAQGGGMSLVLGILITYAIVQFIQTYILEPLVVGTEVNINPLFTIAGLVAGELIWGIAGLVLAIPLLGITKIICDHIPALQPYGFLIGREPSEKKENTLVDKIKNLFKKQGPSRKSKKSG